MKGLVEEFRLYLRRGQGAEIVRPIECQDGITNVITVRQADKRQWKLDVLCCPEDCRSSEVGRGETPVTQAELDTDKLDGLATRV